MESAAAATQALQDNGMDVVPPSETLAGELKDVGATMTEEWLAKAGDNGKTLVEAYRAN